MRHKPNALLEQRRVVTGPLRSDASYGNNGAFLLSMPQGERMQLIVSDQLGWEHVSVVILNERGKPRLPTWNEMCLVKNMWWLPDEAVMQLHPPESEYVNNHPACLHLWRPTEGEIPLPPGTMVGIKELGDISEILR